MRIRATAVLCFSILGVSFGWNSAHAALPVPDCIYYGNAFYNGQPLGEQDTDKTISVKVGAEVVDSYTMGDESEAGDSYVLRVPMDAVDPQAPDRMRPGDGVDFYINDEMGMAVYLGDWGTVKKFMVIVGQGTDSDGDLLWDGWELHFGLNPNDDGSQDPVNGANGDLDGDGYTNLEEQDCGSDPSDPDSVCAEYGCQENDTRQCPIQEGVCAGAVETCSNNQWPGCDPGTYSDYSPSYEEAEANCADGLDNDCDGLPDCEDPDCLCPELYIVDQTGAGDFLTIQACIDAAKSTDTCQVNPGTYVENVDFLGKNLMVVSSEGPESTIIDGNAAGPVVSFQSGENEGAVLDGFTIQSGSADQGGGILCSGADPRIRNCMILDNIANTLGAGILCASASPWITNSVVAHNISSENGGGIGCLECSPIIANSTVYGNEAGTAFLGGGLYCGGTSSPTVVNSILWADTPDEIYVDSGSLIVTYSDVEMTNPLALWPGLANINEDPLLLDPGTGDYRLFGDSPCLDSGDNTAPEVSMTDIAGNVRIADGDGDTSAVVDMGAYEFIGVCEADFDGDGDVDGSDFHAFVSDYILGNLAADLDGSGVVDEADLDVFADDFSRTDCRAPPPM